MYLNPKLYNKTIKDAILEDLGKKDITSFFLIPKYLKSKAFIISNQSGVIAGADLAKSSFKQVDPELKVNIFKKDGSAIKKGDRILKVFGSTRSVSPGCIVYTLPSSNTSTSP